MNWIKIIFAKDIVIAGFISILLFTIANFLFVYYSPSVLKVLPANVTGSISPCYRTLFHHDQRALNRANFVFGDSFSEGQGDEFLDGDDKYGIFNKLKSFRKSELIFGRGGYGNIGTLVEFEQCYPLLTNYTNLNTSNIENYLVTLVFYEGNDLNNNLVEKEREVNTITYKLRFFFPLYDLTYRKIKKTWPLPSIGKKRIMYNLVKMRHRYQYLELSFKFILNQQQPS